MPGPLDQTPAGRRALRDGDAAVGAGVQADAKDAAVGGGAPPAIPDYLREVYNWAYLHPLSIAVFDHDAVVSLILWGNHGRLRDAVLAELEPGQRVLELACVYGDLSPSLAEKVGPRGRLDVIDISPQQVANCQRKLASFPQAHARIADAVQPGGGPYDAVCSFFLLHELPDGYKRAVVDAALAGLAAGGKAIFVDYHRPHWANPLRAVTSLVFGLLEPFAKMMWNREIADFATDGERFSWHKRTSFGGLFQITVATAETPR